jgi:hypothetical protein
VERTDAERSNRDAFDPIRSKRANECMRLLVEEPPSKQQADTRCGQPAERERERARRGRVEPLDIVDGDHHRLALTEEPDHVAHRNGERALIDAIT